MTIYNREDSRTVFPQLEKKIDELIAVNEKQSEEIKTLKTKVETLEEHDYIVEKGTSGKWLYRKWESGRYEAWYDSGATTVTTSTSGGDGWYRNSSEYTINMPTGLGISTVRHAEITVDTDYAYLVTSITHANSTYLGYYVSHLGSLSSVTAYISAYVEGSWT